jgi:zinc transporter ZupT
LTAQAYRENPMRTASASKPEVMLTPHYIGQATEASGISVFAITLHTIPESAAAAMPLHRMGWS